MSISVRGEASPPGTAAPVLQAADCAPLRKAVLPARGEPKCGPSHFRFGQVARPNTLSILRPQFPKVGPHPQLGVPKREHLREVSIYSYCLPPSFRARFCLSRLMFLGLDREGVCSPVAY